MEFRVWSSAFRRLARLICHELSPCPRFRRSTPRRLKVELPAWSRCFPRSEFRVHAAGTLASTPTPAAPKSPQNPSRNNAIELSNRTKNLCAAHNFGVPHSRSQPLRQYPDTRPTQTILPLPAHPMPLTICNPSRLLRLCLVLLDEHTKRQIIYAPIYPRSLEPKLSSRRGSFGRAVPGR